jgi:alanyl-tRNA synthetase
MGLERVASLLQGVGNLYEIDESLPVVLHAADLAGRRYGTIRTTDVRLRVVGDHIRAGLMLIATASHPATRPAATCCAGCCDGWSA